MDHQHRPKSCTKHVVPAKAGTQVSQYSDYVKRSGCAKDLGPRLRGDDVLMPTMIRR